MSDNSGQAGYDPKALGGTLGNKLSQYASTPAPKPLMGGTTTGAFGQILSAAGNPDFQRGTQGAMSEFADIASGKRFGMDDPGYAVVRQGVADDTISGINSVFNSTGRFGAGSHKEALGEGLGGALGALDYANHQNDQARQFQAAGALPGVLAGGMIPGQTQLGIGGMVDQNQMDLQNADYNRFLEMMGAFSGSSQSPGMQEEVPWWQQALGAAAVGSGIFGNIAGGMKGW